MRNLKLNAMLAGVGFNLVKLMKGLGCLFLRLRTESVGFVEFLSAFVWFCLRGAPRIGQSPWAHCALRGGGFCMAD